MTSLLSAWRDWRERQEILRGIRRQKADKSERDRFRVKDNLTYALSALERGDPKQATDLWEKSLSLYPKETRESRLSLSVLLGLRRFDEAQALMRSRLKERPRDSFYAIALGKVAGAKGDNEEALKCWAAVRKDFPGAFEGYVLAAESLMALKRLDEAEVLVKQAIRLFPDNMMGYLMNARVAAQQQNWEEALSRSKLLLDQFKWPSGVTGSAQALAQLGRYDEADAVLEDGRVRFPIDPSLPTESARVAEARGDIPQAVERWKRLVQRFPLHMHANLTAAEALEKLGCFEDAENILRGAVDHFPAELRPALELGLFLFRTRKFEAAAQAFAEARLAFPEHEVAYIRGIEALAAAGDAEDAETLRAEYRAKFKS